MPRLVTEDGVIIQCPACGSTDLEERKKGFDTGLGTLGMLVFGPLGLMAGEIDAEKPIIVCLDCGCGFTLK